MAERVAEGGLAALMEELDAIPFAAHSRLRRPAYYWRLFKAALDFFGHNIPRYHELLVRFNPYPRPFRHVEIPTEDGALIRGWLGAGEPGRPGLVYAPGTFQTKDDTAHKGKVIRVWREWGYSVLVVDMRGFGGSHASWGTGGWLEARDVLEAAKLLREETGAPTVGAMGESLGGASVLNAAAHHSGPELLDGGAIAWSPYADLEEALAHVSTNPGRDSPFYAHHKAYSYLLRARTAGEHDDVREFLHHRARDLGVPVAELVARASPLTHLHRLAVPALVVHAEDDPVVPVGHARRLEEAADGHPHLRVRVLPRGGHCDFDLIAPAWYWRVARRFFRWTMEDGSAAGAGAGAGEGDGGGNPGAGEGDGGGDGAGATKRKL